ncbi:relaxase/mobilization nuclease domain-containing protein [Mucilaginibacter daejeonensis]|uniref:relaxase/mobilization nuclease domain-containing protein n=1 Tax=Mucilaginibacter daejeonensis TaxID=398049 RepID=UPI001D1735CC|nr:relaxase/mobilization nuclease domain-containing protein [Mucilaginibacter daejeonensis]UEG51849.1 relaxase/mobilization nuclease domain-containing protein [Mucilaginibacter daejeonensis]
MTADQVKGKGFKGALRYNLQKVEHGAAKILDMTFTSGKEDSIMREVALIRMLRPNLQKYFYHTSLNFPPNENLGDEQMNIIANEYLNNMGFDQHQYAIFRHYDADHPHLHILVNRIGYDGKVVSDSKDYQRSEQVLRKLEKQHGLTEVISSRQAQERAMTKNELEMMKRTNVPSSKMQLQEIIKDVLSRKPDTAQFIQALEFKGINVLFNQASTGFVSGISYGYEGMQFKGAHLGNAYKWQAIKNAISYEQERDRTAIYQANVRTRELQQSARASESATRGPATGTDGDTKITAGNRKVIQQGAGKLQDQIRAKDSGYQQAARTHGQHSNQSGVPNQKYRIQRGADIQSQQQGRQQVGYQALPGSHLIGSLLGTDHPADDMDQGALNEFKRKRKKRKGQRLG